MKAAAESLVKKGQQVPEALGKQLRGAWVSYVQALSLKGRKTWKDAFGCIQLQLHAMLLAGGDRPAGVL
jgi:hypothetical protein